MRISMFRLATIGLIAIFTVAIAHDGAVVMAHALHPTFWWMFP